MKFERRYERNMMALTPQENQRLKEMKVCVVGCGGLGGYVIEMLGRMGIGYITAVDGDVFDETNLNRQILSSESLVGSSKAQAAKGRMEEVNSEVEIQTVLEFITEKNCRDIIKNHDLVIDALDSISARRILAKGCGAENIAMIHGAIAGWCGQVAIVMPNQPVLDKIYPPQDELTNDEHGEKGEETYMGNPSFIPALVAAIEVAEGIKFLLGKGQLLENRLLTVDVLNHQYDIFEL